MRMVYNQYDSLVRRCANDSMSEARVWHKHDSDKPRHARKRRQEVHFPPHMSKAILAAVKPGDAVNVRGVRLRGVDMVAAVSMQASDAPAVVDNGPPKNEGSQNGHDDIGEKHTKLVLHKHSDVQGIVAHVLHGPKGEERGALLEDGIIVRMPSQAAESLHANLAPGRKLAARGVELTNDLGTVLEATRSGLPYRSSPRRARRSTSRQPDKGGGGCAKPPHIAAQKTKRAIFTGCARLVITVGALMPVGSRGVLLNSVEPSACATDSGFRLLSLDPVDLLSTGRRTAAVGAYLEVFLVT